MTYQRHMIFHQQAGGNLACIRISLVPRLSYRWRVDQRIHHCPSRMDGLQDEEEDNPTFTNAVKSYSGAGYNRIYIR